MGYSIEVQSEALNEMREAFKWYELQINFVKQAPSNGKSQWSFSFLHQTIYGEVGATYQYLRSFREFTVNYFQSFFDNILHPDKYIPKK